MEYKVEILRFYGDSHKNIRLNAILNIFVVLAALKHAKHAVLIFTPRILIPE